MGEFLGNTAPVLITVLIAVLTLKALKEIIAAEARREAEEKRKIDSVLFVVRSDFIRDHQILKEIGWVTAEAEERSDAERQLKIQCAEKGGNAVTKLHFTKSPYEYKAGYGPKGNPYYRTGYKTNWEGQAVLIDAPSYQIDAPSYQTSALRSDAGSELPTTCAVVDGSNVAHWDGEPSLTSVKLVMDALRREGVVAKVFFDANIGFIFSNNHTTEKEIAEELGVAEDQVLIVPGGEQADSFILKYALATNSFVVTNDRFRDRSKLASGLKLRKGRIVGGIVILGD